MRIAIDLTSLYKRKITGVEIYGIDLYKILKKTNHTIIPIFHVENTLDNNANAYIIPQCNRLWLENIALSKAVRRIKADIVLFPVFPPPIDLYWGCKSKFYQTIHDTVAFRFRNTQNKAAKYYYVPRQMLALKFLDGIITISETVKRQLQDISALPIYNCGNIIAPEYRNCQTLTSKDVLWKWDVEPGRYFISVSTIEPRKNFSYMMKVLKPVLDRKDMKLVLVGRKGWGKDENLRNQIEEMGDKLVFTDFVEFNQLVSLYRFAYAFGLFSLDEGFGRTPFEAVACGCKRIILSDIDIFHETFEGNALFIPLNDKEKASEMILYDELPEVSQGFKLPFDVLGDKVINEFLPYVVK